MTNFLRLFLQIKKKQEQLLKVRNFLPPQSQEPEIHLLEKLVNSAVDADKKIESANKGELKENGGKTLEKYTIIWLCWHQTWPFFKLIFWNLFNFGWIYLCKLKFWSHMSYSVIYRVSHIEVWQVNQLWGVEGFIILLKYDA